MTTRSNLISVCKDDVYLNRYLLFYLTDGRCISSKDANFHQVELSKIVMLELNIKHKKYRINKADLPDTFVEFTHHRSKGMDFIVNNESGLSVPMEFNSWSIGWTDGTTEYLAEIDFQTGDLIRNYSQSITISLPSHFHPQSKVYERGVNAQ